MVVSSMVLTASTPTILPWWRGKPELERTPLPPIMVDLNERLAA